MKVEIDYTEFLIEVLKDARMLSDEYDQYAGAFNHGIEVAMAMVEYSRKVVNNE